MAYIEAMLISAPFAAFNWGWNASAMRKVPCRFTFTTWAKKSGAISSPRAVIAAQLTSTSTLPRRAAKSFTAAPSVTSSWV